MKILQINSSARRQGAVSSALASDIARQLQARHPDSELVVRDLAFTPVSPLDDAALQALMLGEAARSAAQAARVAEYDALIAEAQAAEVWVLGVPMYNLGVTAQLKHWIDAICRAGVTFRYTEAGPQGLLTGKRVYIALSRGGIYRDAAFDTQVPYLRTVLGFLGVQDVQFVYAEGLGLGEAAVTQALAAAQAEIAALA